MDLGFTPRAIVVMVGYARSHLTLHSIPTGPNGITKANYPAAITFSV